MKYPMMMVLAAFALLATNVQAQQAEDSDWIAIPQIGGIVGVPAMPGMIESKSETIVFDKPEGRLMEARLQGPASPSEVHAWYKVALVANGWVEKDGPSNAWLWFVREGEVLQLNAAPRDGGTELFLSLAPQKAP